MSKSHKVAVRAAAWVKAYIGQSKSSEQIPNGVEVTICLINAEPFVFEYEGKKYLKFAVVEHKEPDNFGRTHALT
ncbi:MAG: hypothetical protein Q8J69_08815 [Sphingobacteriaceae bacterium]|nr:hypothetical protein [Sphingobacteriaceae bacterium]